MVHRGLWVLLFTVACNYESTQTIDAPPPPTVGFEFAASGADEQVGVVKIPVVLSKASAIPVSVNFTTLNSETATLVDDFELMANKVTFDPGVTRAEIQVMIKTDFDESEAAETVELALTDPVGADLDQIKGIHEILIADHLLPRINFATTTTTTTEGTKSQLVVNLTAPSEGESTVVVGVTPTGTHPTDSEDIGLVEGTVVTFPPGAMTQTVDIDETPDLLDEEDTETVQFDLKGASVNLVLGAMISDVHSITDDDNPPTVEFEVVSSTVNEDGTSVTLNVNLLAESGRLVTVNYARNAGDTADNADATVTGSSVTFNPHTPGVTGETQKTITITIANDNIDEDAETVVVDLGTATNANVNPAKATHTLTINTDATDRPKVEFMKTTTTVTEGANPNIALVLSNPSTKTVTVTYTATGTATNGNSSADYSLTSPGTVTFNPLVTSRNLQVNTNNNSPGSEPDETVILTLSAPNNADLGTQTVHTLTIQE